MTRKDYEAFADVLAEALNDSQGSPAAYCMVERIANDMVAVFSQDNPRFDSRKFLRTCGMDA